MCDLLIPLSVSYVYRCINVVSSKDNLDSISMFKNGKQKSKKLLKLKHI